MRQLIYTSNHRQKKVILQLESSTNRARGLQSRGVFGIYNSLVLLHFVQKLQNKNPLALKYTKQPLDKRRFTKMLFNRFWKPIKYRYVTNSAFFFNANAAIRVIGNRRHALRRKRIKRVLKRILFNYAASRNQTKPFFVSTSSRTWITTMRRMFKALPLSRSYLLKRDHKRFKKRRCALRFQYVGPARRYSSRFSRYIGLFFKKIKRLRVYRKFCRAVAKWKVRSRRWPILRDYFRHRKMKKRIAKKVLWMGAPWRKYRFIKFHRGLVPFRARRFVLTWYKTFKRKKLKSQKKNWTYFRAGTWGRRPRWAPNRTGLGFDGSVAYTRHAGLPGYRARYRKAYKPRPALITKAARPALRALRRAFGMSKSRRLQKRYSVEFRRDARYARRALHHRVLHSLLKKTKNEALPVFRYFRFMLPRVQFQRISSLWLTKRISRQLSRYLPVRAGWAFFDSGRLAITRAFTYLKVFQQKPFEYRNTSLSYMSRVLTRTFLNSSISNRGRLWLFFVSPKGKLKHKFQYRHVCLRNLYAARRRAIRKADLIKRRTTPAARAGYQRWLARKKKRNKFLKAPRGKRFWNFFRTRRGTLSVSRATQRRSRSFYYFSHYRSNTIYRRKYLQRYREPLPVYKPRRGSWRDIYFFWRSSKFGRRIYKGTSVSARGAARYTKLPRVYPFSMIYTRSWLPKHKKGYRSKTPPVRYLKQKAARLASYYKYRIAGKRKHSFSRRMPRLSEVRALAFCTSIFGSFKALARGYAKYLSFYRYNMLRLRKRKKQRSLHKRKSRLRKTFSKPMYYRARNKIRRNVSWRKVLASPLRDHVQPLKLTFAKRKAQFLFCYSRPLRGLYKTLFTYRAPAGMRQKLDYQAPKRFSYPASVMVRWEHKFCNLRSFLRKRSTFRFSRKRRKFRRFRVVLAPKRKSRWLCVTHRGKFGDMLAVKYSLRHLFSGTPRQQKMKYFYLMHRALTAISQGRNDTAAFRLYKRASLLRPTIMMYNFKNRLTTARLARTPKRPPSYVPSPKDFVKNRPQFQKYTNYKKKATLNLYYVNRH